MQFFRWHLISISLLLLSISFPVLAFAKTVPALAVLSQLKGEVKAGPAKKMMEGFDGKMLWKRYRVRTEKKSGATIFFHLVEKVI